MQFLAIILAAFLGISALLFAQNGLLITGHEGDLLHTLDLAFRMAAGQRQHIDTMTPLGHLAIWPIAALLEAGLPPGRALRLAEVGVAACLLPMVWWVSWSRLDGVLRYAFGLGVVLLPLALVFGGDEPSLSFSMYYNRWAWALAALVVAVLFLPARRGSVVADALVLGLCVAALLLIKATYVLALAPFGLAALAHDRQGRLFFAALLVLIAVLVAATIWLGGLEFWRAYLKDLLVTAASPLRPQPGETFANLLAKPAFLPGTLLALLAIVYWRKTGLAREGLLLLIAAPGWIYITYQNWGNDPKWLALLAVLLFARANPPGARPFWGVPARAFGQVLGAVAVVLILPSLFNIYTSPMRHALTSTKGFAPIFTDLRHDDILVKIATHRAPRTQSVLPGILFAEGAEAPEAEPKPTPGRDLIPADLEECNTLTGLVGWQTQVAAEMGAVESAVGRQVLVADLLDALWLFGPFEPAPKGAPWYYGGDAGFEGAEFVLVPLCPLSTRARDAKLDWIAEAGWQLEEEIRTGLFILMRRASP